MIRVTVHRSGPIAGLAPRLDRAGDRWVAEAAQEYVAEHADRIDRGVRPDGRPQRRNTAETIRRKGHGHPLRDTGALQRDARIISRGDTQTVALAISEAAVRGLEALGYEVVGSGPGLSRRLQRAGLTELRRATR